MKKNLLLYVVIFVVLTTVVSVGFFVPSGIGVLCAAEECIDAACTTYELEPVQWRNENNVSTEAEKELIDILDINLTSMIFDIPDEFDYVLTDSEGQEYLVHFTHKVSWSDNTYVADEPVLITK